MNTQECENLLRRYNCNDSVIRHCRAVAELALRIADFIPECNRELIRTGALLHDIGRGLTHGIRHAWEGYLIAQQEHLPVNVCSIIRDHIGAGLSAAEAAAAGLPEQNYIPSFLESKITAHADNLLSGTKRRSFEEVMQKTRALNIPAAYQRMQDLHNELSVLTGMNLDTI